MVKLRNGKICGHYGYIDMVDLNRKYSSTQLISILRNMKRDYDENETEVLFLVRKEEI
jgi:hypothetical protein